MESWRNGIKLYCTVPHALYCAYDAVAGRVGRVHARVGAVVRADVELPHAAAAQGGVKRRLVEVA